MHCSPNMAVSLLLLSLLLCYAVAVPPPYPFVTENLEEAINGKQYDYIVVGGGTAGCALAATLSEKYEVLVLERGGSSYDVKSIQNENTLFETLSNADNYTSAAQAFVSEDGVQGVRGRVLGGSSALNFGFYSRASKPYMMSMGWNQSLVMESYQWVESMVVTKNPPMKVWQKTLKNALIEAGVVPDNGFTLDHMVGTKRSGTTFDANGRRQTAAEFLRNANPTNINVLLHATVSKIIFYEQTMGMPPKVRGVEFMDTNGKSHEALLKENEFICRAKGTCSEVILCAGALGSPQLLLLSGIGPSEHLQDMAIDVKVNLPGVGKGMADTPRNNITIVSKVPLAFSMPQAVGILGVTPNEEAFVESFSMQDPNGTYLAYIAEKVAMPVSQGELKLSSLDPRENPSVRFNYLANSIDVGVCSRTMGILGKLMQTQTLANFMDKTAMKSIVEDSLPQDLNDQEAMSNFCRKTVQTMWHYHGGCKFDMVIDRSYRVLGNFQDNNIRVVDASTHASSPGTNPQATTMMLGRYVGVMILRERANGMMVGMKKGT